MARLACVIVPDCPHHLTQRGNPPEPIVFDDGDQDVYRDRLAEQTRKRGVEVWADCLTPVLCAHHRLRRRARPATGELAAEEALEAFDEGLIAERAAGGL